jgi:hypothetical protein
VIDGPGPAGPINTKPPVEVFVVDREKTCPLLIRVFIKPGSHHRLEDFAIRGKEPGGDSEIQVLGVVQKQHLSAVSLFTSAYLS